MNQSRRDCVIGFFAALFGSVSAAVGNALMPKAAPKERNVYTSTFTTDKDSKDMSWPVLHACYLLPASMALAKAIHEEHAGDMNGKLVTIEIKIRRR